MPYQLQIGQQQITLPENNYTNCHQFTSGAILTMYQQFRSQMPNNVIAGIMGIDVSNINEWRALYDRWKYFGTAFNQPACAQIPVGSLILFYDYGNTTLQHSMLVTQLNEWTGANNFTSIGAPDAFVHIYQSISTRNWVLNTQGGWSNQEMVSLVEQPAHYYHMYHFRVFNAH